MVSMTDFHERLLQFQGCGLITVEILIIKSPYLGILQGVESQDFENEKQKRILTRLYPTSGLKHCPAPYNHSKNANHGGIREWNPKGKDTSDA
jgi:hypothetical protein